MRAEILKPARTEGAYILFGFRIAFFGADIYYMDEPEEEKRGTYTTWLGPMQISMKWWNWKRWQVGYQTIKWAKKYGA